MGALWGIPDIFRKDWKLFLATNAFYFGLVIVGVLIALASPGTQAIMVKAILQGATSGQMAPVTQAYSSGSVLRAAATTFRFNFVSGTLLYITIPSLVLPPVALLTGGFRALIWGIALVLPYGSMTMAKLLPHYPTLLLEGEGYVVAIFGSMRQIMALLWPGRFGRQSRTNAYLAAIVDNLKLLPVVAAILAVSALYEALEVMLVNGLIK